MNSRNKLRLLSVAVAMTMASMSVPMASAGGLQNKMDAVFNDMSNVSRPGVFETQRRGVLSGGSAYVRSPIMNTELVNLQAPSFKAGCGGIDFFGGSFSFINADQFVQLLRSVASNAKGYAFQIALDIACPDCMAWINNLQSKIQKLNEQLGNSCQLAQGLVTDVANAFGANRDNQYSLVGTVTGLKDDFFSSKDSPDKGKEVDEKNPEKAKDVVGNIVWDALKKSKANKWVTPGAESTNEKEEYEILMSVTGSIVIPKAEDDAQNPDTGSTNNPEYLTPKIGFKELLDGGNVTVYSCNDDDCLKPTEKSVNTVGMVTRIYDLLVGDGASAGIIAKFGQTSNNSFTAKEDNLMSNMPADIGVIVRNLSTASAVSAIAQAHDISYAVAMTWANEMLIDQIKAVRQALRTSNKAEVKELLQQLADREKSIALEYESYRAEHPVVADLVKQYNEVQKNILKVAVVATNGVDKATLGDH